MRRIKFRASDYLKMEDYIRRNINSIYGIKKCISYKKGNDNAIGYKITLVDGLFNEAIAKDIWSTKNRRVFIENKTKECILKEIENFRSCSVHRSVEIMIF